MKTRLKTSASIMLLALLLPGCALMLHGSSDTITVNSLLEGTMIYIDGVPRGIDVANAQVDRGTPHTIMVKKAGYQTVIIETGDRLDGVMWLGILIDFGIFSIPIDLISGAAWKTDPLLYTITPLVKDDDDGSH
jgi:hypothetical protein